MGITTMLFNTATSVSAPSWENAHGDAMGIFGAAGLAYVVAGLFFADKQDKTMTLLAMIPGMSFTVIGLIIYLFG